MLDALSVEVESHDLPVVVDPRGECERSIGVVENGVVPVFEQVAMGHTAGVGIAAHDFAVVVDIGGLVEIRREARPGMVGGAGRVDRCKMAALFHEAVLYVISVDIETYDLTFVIAADGISARKGRGRARHSSGIGIIQRREFAVVQPETVGEIGGVAIIARVLFLIVYPEYERSLNAKRRTSFPVPGSSRVEKT